MQEENKGFSVSDIIAETIAEEKDSTPEAPPPEAPSKDAASPEAPVDKPAEDAAPSDPKVEAAPPPEQDHKAQVEQLTKHKQTLEQEVQRLNTGFQQVLSEVDKYLHDPKLYREARIKAGLATPEEASPPDRLVQEPDINIDAIQDIPSLIKEVKRAVALAVINERKHHETAIQDAVARAEASFRTETNTALQPHYLERWKSAISEMSKEYGPKFVEVETELRSSLLQDPAMEDIRTAYSNKRISERDALERVFKTKYEDRWLEHKVSQRLAKEKKTDSVKTEPKPARKTHKGSSSASKSQGTSFVSDIIAETDADLSS